MRTNGTEKAERVRFQASPPLSLHVLCAIAKGHASALTCVVHYGWNYTHAALLVLVILLCLPANYVSVTFTGFPSLTNANWHQSRTGVPQMAPHPVVNSMFACFRVHCRCLRVPLALADVSCRYAHANTPFLPSTTDGTCTSLI
jgi:hypothetical protein